MQRLEVSGAVRHTYICVCVSLGNKGLRGKVTLQNRQQFVTKPRHTTNATNQENCITV
jgi:hypothetical protein